MNKHGLAPRSLVPLLIHNLHRAKRDKIFENSPALSTMNLRPE
jgi:hypothetical protein